MPTRVELKRWKEVIEHFQNFLTSSSGLGSDDDSAGTEWIFRGEPDAEYQFPLAPSIERRARDPGVEWAALEDRVTKEFRARASLYLKHPPATNDELTWLALMQHYGIPTRLLDFTLSPFVALYFAVRGGCKQANYTRVWAIESHAINVRFVSTVQKAQLAERQRRGETQRVRRLSFNPDDSATDCDAQKTRTSVMRKLTKVALTATGTLRGELNRHGCVCALQPPSFNPRLASQQGLFLVNCAEHRPLESSLATMMEEHRSADWCKAFDITAALLPEVEGRLFQMNINEQSLFPDLHGLAGLINQRIRLHWTSG